MPVTRDIVATYRGPGAVMRRLLADNAREDRALAMVMAGCAVMFIAQWPRLARQAHLESVDLNPLLGAALLAWVFIAPLILYALAFLAFLLARLLGGKGTTLDARIALFWALLATSPLVLLHGLVAGFIGTGLQLQLVGAVWFLAFIWFWLTNMRVAGWSPK
jgi:nitrogen fixation/metabolism regulation signal transduction histidine kinase